MSTPPRIAGLAPDIAAEFARSRSARGALHTDAFVDAWIRRARVRANLRARRIPLFGLEQWRIDPATGNIQHEAGRFFTLLGTKVRLRHHFDELEWDQPFIDQPEVGILGILAARFDGVLHLCLQAKEEPGNLHGVQLSPTVQATYSNYTQSHGGRPPPLVELFLRPRADDVLYARLQTEDGGRFLFKSNRNMIVRCEAGVMPPRSTRFIWLTLRQIAALMKRDNVINACARSILSALLHPPHQETPGAPAIESEIRRILDWLDQQKSITHLHVKRVPLASLADWRVNRKGYFVHREDRFFQIIGLEVSSKDREISTWNQPILENRGEGIIGLLVQNIRGRRCVLMQAKAEPGNRPPIQLAPTVQFTPANYLDNLAIQRPFLFEEFIRPSHGRLIYESRQPEEGARFFREDNVHRIIEVPPGTELDLPDHYRWMPLEAVSFFLHLGEHVNSCARSILACML